MNDTFNYIDIHGPVLPIEYVAITSHILGILAIGYVLYGRIIAALAHPTRVATITVGLAVASLVTQIISLIGEYGAEGPVAWVLANAKMRLGFFQIYVYDRLRLGASFKKNKSVLIYGVTGLLFLAVATPQCLRYGVFDPYNSTPSTDFWIEWNKYSFIWVAYIGILDFFLNIIIFRSLLVSSNATSQKWTLFGMCVFVLAMDFAGLACYYFQSDGQGEIAKRWIETQIVFANTAYCFHSATGLSYLSIALSFKHSFKVPRPSPKLAPPLKKGDVGNDTEFSVYTDVSIQ